MGRQHTKAVGPIQNCTITGALEIQICVSEVLRNGRTRETRDRLVFSRQKLCISAKRFTLQK